MFYGKNLRQTENIVLSDEHSNSLTCFRFVDGLKVLLMRTLILVVRGRRFSMGEANTRRYIIISEYLYLPSEKKIVYFFKNLIVSCRKMSFSFLLRVYTIGINMHWLLW